MIFYFFNKYKYIYISNLLFTFIKMGGASDKCPVSNHALDTSTSISCPLYGHFQNGNYVIYPDGSCKGPVFHNPDQHGNYFDENEIVVKTSDQNGIVMNGSLWKLLTENPRFEEFKISGKNLYKCLQELCKILDNYNHLDHEPFNIRRKLFENMPQYFGIYQHTNKDLLKYYVNPFLEEYIEEPLLGENKKINGEYALQYLNSIVNLFFYYFLE